MDKLDSVPSGFCFQSCRDSVHFAAFLSLDWAAPLLGSRRQVPRAASELDSGCWSRVDSYHRFHDDQRSGQQQEDM